MVRKIKPVHPGEILSEEFLRPLGISQYRLAKDTSVPPRRINEIVHGKRIITADTALRLSRYFGTSERFWMNLQVRYDLEVQKDNLGKRIEQEVVARERPADYPIGGDRSAAKASKDGGPGETGKREKTMGIRRSKYNESGIKGLPDDKPVVYRIKTVSGKDNYIGSAKRYRSRERIAEHLGEIPGVRVEIEKFDSIQDARMAEKRLIEKNKPKYNEGK